MGVSGLIRPEEVHRDMVEYHNWALDRAVNQLRRDVARMWLEQGQALDSSFNSQINYHRSAICEGIGALMMEKNCTAK
uniref:Uncharacterized protein n=1 Tax=Nelumbo nucifera TaxID=4432 RepID=A0A822ZM03_NELNU|nr:TPA_asm: hypothetical protein HUJ06_002781 [Nelumbo nucifera]